MCKYANSAMRNVRFATMCQCDNVPAWLVKNMPMCIFMNKQIRKRVPLNT